jgi:fucose 4-O-acetylase-like acetyltransferase
MPADPSTSDTAPDARRDSSVDFLKGVLIVLMIYGHTFLVGSLRDGQAYTVRWIYSFHMEAFLLVAGYYFAPRLESRPILRPLLRKLLLPYLLFEPLYLLGLVVAAGAGMNTVNAPPESLAEFLDLVFLHPIGAFWFIHALILLQLAFALARRVAGGSVGGGSLWLALAAVLGALVSTGVLREWAAVFFVLGVLLGLRRLPLDPSPLLAGTVAIACLLLSAGEPMELSILQVAWVLAITALLMACSRGLPSVVQRLFAWLGQNTLILLVTHALVTVASKPAAPAVLALEPTGLLFAGTVVLAAIAVGLASARLSDALSLSPVLFGTQKLYAPFPR